MSNPSTRLKFREEIVDYFKRITRLVPTKEQVDVLNNLADTDIKNLCLCCGRGFSKTMLSAVATLWFADVYSDAIGRPLEILLVSSQERMYTHLENFFRDNVDLKQKLVQTGVVFVLPRNGFQLKNLSVINTSLATQHSIRGNRADVIFVDEACLIKDQIYHDSILPCSTGDIAKVVILSTPSNPKGFFIDIVDSPKKHNFVLKSYTSEVCPWQVVSNARLKKELSPHAYATEVLARPPTKSERAYFSSVDIDTCIIPCEPNREGKEYSRLEAGIDFGYGKPNVTALLITEKLGSKRKIIYLKTWKSFNAEELGDLINSFKPAFVKADSMPKEFIKNLQPYCKQKIYPIDAKIHKDWMLEQLQSRVRLHQLVIPHSYFVELVQELKRYHKGKRAGDNRVDSLALSCYEPETPLAEEGPRVVSINGRRIYG